MSDTASLWMNTSLVAAAVVATFYLAFGDGSKPQEYPAPLVTWARNMNGRIDGAQCEVAGTAMVCDVRIDGGTWTKVNCDGDKCWLQWTQCSCR